MSDEPSKIPATAKLAFLGRPTDMSDEGIRAFSKMAFEKIQAFLAEQKQYEESMIKAEQSTRQPIATPRSNNPELQAYLEKWAEELGRPLMRQDFYPAESQIEHPNP